MIAIGTSGFSYNDWKGYFYPKNINAKDMLEFYAQTFSVVELNYTYYRMPEAKQIEGFIQRTPQNFSFCVKAHKSLTHELNVPVDVIRDAAGTFRESMKPLVDHGRLGCVLVQFPWSFKKTIENLDYLRYLKELIPNLPIVVEFRNSQWVEQAVFQLLKSLSFGYCCVDEPRLKGLMPPVAVVTSNIGYIRFHGRNAEKWWKHEQAFERYNYLYSKDELLEWVGKIRGIAKRSDKTFVLFNNHYQGQAAVNAKMMEELLGDLIKLR